MTSPAFLPRKLLSVENGTGDLKFMTYNTLAQSLIRRSRYSTNGDAVKWKSRSKDLEAQIKEYSPDILALQEVDSASLKFWRAIMESVGLDGCFHCSPGKSHGVYLAWRKSLYQQVRKRTISYDRSTSRIPKQAETGNVGLLISLKPVSGNNALKSLVVATTHLYWHPMASFEKARQLHDLLEATQEFAREMDDAPKLVVLGDFNVVPYDSPYLLARGLNLGDQAVDLLQKSVAYSDFSAAIPALVVDRDEVQENAQPPVPPLLDLKYQSALNILQAAYAALDVQAVSVYSKYHEVHPENSGVNGEPRYTNWAGDFQGTLDYIFILKWKHESEEKERVIVHELLRIPEEAELGPEPNSLPRQGVNPSDHFALLASISWD